VSDREDKSRLDPSRIRDVLRQMLLWDWLRGRRGKPRQAGAVVSYVFVGLVIITAATGPSPHNNTSSMDAAAPPPSSSRAPTSTTAVSTTRTSVTPVRDRRRSMSKHHPRRRARHSTTAADPRPRARAEQLVLASASAHSVQAQPPPRSCHARRSGLYIKPDPACTPGSLNPAVTQATIMQTICVSGWTETVRPSESITEPEKLASLAAYDDGGSPHGYEYDHLVSLELGGALNDPRNLWPEPGASPNPKDSVENALHRLVCDGQLQLAQAQHIIATNWASWAKSHPAPPSARTPTHATPPPETGGGPDKPIADVNCSDFATHAAAQQWFAQHGGSPTNDVAGLDGNANGLACESLP
jgi:hypothetical protein